MKLFIKSGTNLKKKKIYTNFRFIQILDKKSGIGYTIDSTTAVIALLLLYRLTSTYFYYTGHNMMYFQPTIKTMHYIIIAQNH